MNRISRKMENKDKTDICQCEGAFGNRWTRWASLNSLFQRRVETTSDELASDDFRSLRPFLLPAGDFADHLILAMSVPCQWIIDRLIRMAMSRPNKFLSSPPSASECFLLRMANEILLSRRRQTGRKKLLQKHSMCSTTFPRDRFVKELNGNRCFYRHLFFLSLHRAHRMISSLSFPLVSHFKRVYLHV